MNIEFYAKSNYGRINFYIKDEKVAKAISNLTGKKTIDEFDIKNLEELGFTFTEVIAPR